ncbi:hypothetical protein BDM02DRAFT_3117884 [Thelephora ganbajun]|uniref:Uncharacterized protein n=1 Tax=Thelephora ganbajun TaxID=370292 RepID=A0ACB6ZB02_THEGA|nr:hypothetical protein BDM02DRAFT_3117884 [Thelephora ganbajun]
MNYIDDDSPWDADPNPSHTHQSEWSKITSDFTNAGYREGITAGKESALQTGFDAGYTQVGVPLGREIGLLRGAALALMTFIDSPQLLQPPEVLAEAQREIQSISAQLSDIRFSDIVPRDLEAEAHAREHLADDEGDLPVNGLDENGFVQNEEVTERRKMEQLEDMMSSFGTSPTPSSNLPRPGPEDVKVTRVRLLQVARTLGLELDLD